MLYLLIALQLADLLTTHYALRTGIGTEANPLLKRLFDKFGHLPVLIVVKSAFIGLLWWAYPYMPQWVLYGMAAFYVWIVMNNLKVIRGR